MSGQRAGAGTELNQYLDVHADVGVTGWRRGSPCRRELGTRGRAVEPSGFAVVDATGQRVRAAPGAGAQRAGGEPRAALGMREARAWQHRGCGGSQMCESWPECARQNRSAVSQATCCCSRGQTCSRTLFSSFYQPNRERSLCFSLPGVVNVGIVQLLYVRANQRRICQWSQFSKSFPQELIFSFGYRMGEKAGSILDIVLLIFLEVCCVRQRGAISSGPTTYQMFHNIIWRLWKSRFNK